MVGVVREIYDARRFSCSLVDESRKSGSDRRRARIAGTASCADSLCQAYGGDLLDDIVRIEYQPVDIKFDNNDLHSRTATV